VWRAWSSVSDSLLIDVAERCIDAGVTVVTMKDASYPAALLGTLKRLQFSFFAVRRMLSAIVELALSERELPPHQASTLLAPSVRSYLRQVLP
jgi:hypothetical protein